MTPSLLLSCGEPSGDLYAGALTRELRTLAPGISVAGRGSPQFASAGGDLLGDYRGIAATGVTGVIPKLPRIVRMWARLVAAAREGHRDALVVIDFADFNFRLARRVKKLGIPVVYYISPQIWAWRPGRLETIRKLANRVLVIFPFEEEIYRKARVPVEFVGHPLVDLARSAVSRDVFLRAAALRTRSAHGRDSSGQPSRNEVTRIHCPDLLEAAKRIRALRGEGAICRRSRAPHLDDRLFAAVRGAGLPPMAIVEGETGCGAGVGRRRVDGIRGQATVQSRAPRHTPMVVVYRLSALRLSGSVVGS